MSYNGWTNYETWLYHMHNSDGMDLTDYYDSKPDVDEVSEMLKSAAYEDMDECHTLTPYQRDVLSQALREVNFHEIAYHLIDSYFPEDTESEDNED